METKFYTCSCLSLEHLFCITCDQEDCFISIHLAKKGFLDRLFHAIKYIFGYRCKYGDFEEIIVKKENVKEIIDILQKYQQSSS